MELSQSTFEGIRSLMYDSIGLSLADSKRSLVASRLATRIQRLGLEGFEAYLERLLDDAWADEFQMAVDLLTTNETYFFREAAHFERLAKDLPGIAGGRTAQVWSAACSFGDEVYTLAMVMADLQMAGRLQPGWSILGTDISHRVLMAAKQAIYPEDRLRHVRPEHLKRYCLRGEGVHAGQSRIQQKLRERVQFGQLNLTRDFSGLGPFDAVFLRNVLIYFDPPTKVAVVRRVLQTLRPGGLFFMGIAEGRVQDALPIEPVEPGVWRKTV